MAGTVAKFNPEYYESFQGGMHYNTNSLRNMEENEVLNNLSDGSKETKTEVLQKLRNAARRNGGKLPYADQQAVFRGLALALNDPNWEIRHQCIQLIHEIIPDFGDGLDKCMALVLPKLVSTMGDSKISIRRAVIQTLHVYMKTTNDVQHLFKCIVQHGIENTDSKIKKEIIVSLPMLFTPEFGQEDFFEITRALMKRLLDSADDHLKTHVLLSLEKIRDLVGDSAFVSYLKKVAAPLRRYYNKLAGREDPNEPLTDRGQAVPSPSSKAARYTGEKSNYSHYDGNTPVNGGMQNYGSDLEFGVVPSHVMMRLNDQSNFRNRAQAVEELKSIINELTDMSPLEAHVVSFINFLNNLLDDSNFKITTVTLDILDLVVLKLESRVKPHLKDFIQALTKRMGDNKTVVRQAIMKVVMHLMQTLDPKPVLSVINENLSHRNSRVRQETLNMIIASLLRFPSSYFDLGSLCQRVAPCLVDLKRPVRQASLECFAVLASDMGAGRLQPLVQAVDSVELSYDGDGAMAAVQARLARRQLPKLDQNRLVEYATPSLLNSATMRGASHGADIDWILSASSGGSGSASSARSSGSDMLELESIPSSSARSTPTELDYYSQPSTPRRHPSAKKKGTTGMPWDVENSPKTSTSKATKETKDMMGSEIQKAALERKKERQERGYRQIHQGKIQRQTSDVPLSQPFSMYNGNNVTNGKDGKSTFSSTWNDSSTLDSARKHQHPQKGYLLDPISAPDKLPPYVPNWSEHPMDDDKVKSDRSPIPMKPKLVRGPSSRRKVPPISDVAGEHYETEQDSERDSVLSMLEDDAREEIDNNSLRQIRNSATKKKVEKLFGQKQSSRSPSPPSSVSDPFEDSGMFSQFSTLRSDIHDPDTPPGSSSKKKKKDVPFESKPRVPVRKGSKGEGSITVHSEVMSTTNYKPFGGVTFKENRDSDVAIVGRGYGEDSQPADPRPSQHAQKARERRRQTNSQKGSMLSPLAMASQHSVGAMDMDDDVAPGGVVGKGVFDGGMEHMPVRRSSRTEVTNPPAGVYGVGVRHGSQDKNSSPEDDDDDEESEDEDVGSMSMSMTMRTRLVEERERKEQLEIERQEAEEAEIERRHREVERLRIQKQEEAEKARARRQQQQEQEARKREEERKRLQNLTDLKDELDGSMGSSVSSNQKQTEPISEMPLQQPSPVSIKRSPKLQKPKPKKKKVPTATLR